MNKQNRFSALFLGAFLVFLAGCSTENLPLSEDQAGEQTSMTSLEKNSHTFPGIIPLPDPLSTMWW